VVRIALDLIELSLEINSAEDLDIFALGSSIYRLVAGMMHIKIEKELSLQTLLFGSIIAKCWMQNFHC
jgi:hypothetical protein